MFGNKPSCWFLPGLKAQANAKTKATHRKARILGAIPHMIYIYHIYSSYDMYIYISYGFIRKQKAL